MWSCMTEGSVDITKDVLNARTNTLADILDENRDKFPMNLEAVFIMFIYSIQYFKEYKLNLGTILEATAQAFNLKTVIDKKSREQ